MKNCRVGIKQQSLTLLYMYLIRFLNAIPTFERVWGIQGGKVIVFWPQTKHSWGGHGRDRMVVGFTTTYAISAYHHWCYEFESLSGRGVQHYVIKLSLSVTCDRPVVFSGSSGVLHHYIVESGVKHHQTNKQTKHR